MAFIGIRHFSTETFLRRVALGYLIAWVLSPPLAYGASWRVLAILSMLLWFALELRSSRSILTRPNFVILAALTFSSYALAIEWLVPDMSDVNRQFPIWIMFFFLIVGESLSRGRDDDARFCFWLVLLLLPVWMTTTLWGIDNIAADVARTLSRSSDEAEMLARRGIGGYGFIYTVLLCLPFLAYFTMHARARQSLASGSGLRPRLLRLLVVLNFALACTLLFRAGYSIALLLAGLAVALVILVRSRRGLPFAISIATSGLVVFIMSIALPPSLEYLESTARGTEYAAKIRDLSDSLAGGQSTGTVEDRTERYSRSLALFLEHPLIGTLAFDDVGKHSAILDRFAQYGIVIGALFFFLIAYYPLRVLRQSCVPIGLGLSFAVVAIMFPMLNNVFMSWGLILYVFSRGALSVLGIPLEWRRSRRDATSEYAHA